MNPTAYSRFRLSGLTRDQLLALLWRGTNILPSTPITYRNKEIQFQLFLQEHHTHGMRLLSETPTDNVVTSRTRCQI